MKIGDQSSYLPTLFPPAPPRRQPDEDARVTPTKDAAQSGQGRAGPKSGHDANPEEQRQVRELQARDRDVRAHEQAHRSAAGPYAMGGASYTYQVGPDGHRYAVGGEVRIDTAPIAGDPHATLQKAQTVQRAALAPAEPSAQDRAVAAAASRMAMEAQADIVAENREHGQSETRPGNQKPLQEYHAVSQGTLASATAGEHVNLLA